uniref:Uncharacterized protein n=1 Tax=Setaria italica TaxID=4555 RepID=K4AHC9_SETIT
MPECCLSSARIERGAADAAVEPNLGTWLARIKLSVASGAERGAAGEAEAAQQVQVECGAGPQTKSNAFSHLIRRAHRQGVQRRL